jgi:RHS repeat-associated core domain
LGFALKVMAGDRIDIFGKSYYFQNNTGGNNYNVPVSAILDGFLNSPAAVAAGKTSSAELNGLSVITNAIGDFLSDSDRDNNGTSATPKAYINYIFLDEHFRFVTGNFSRVGAANGVKDHYDDASMQHIAVPKNGYIYVYVSNESPVNVFFDNLQVIHTRGPVFEETHYYPFGLTMAGISSKALKPNYTENKKKYNGIEYEYSFDLNIGETFYRTHDPQIGRWWQIDPKPSDWESPYAAMGNNPISNMDFLGDSIAPGRTKGMNFFVTASKDLQKKDISAHMPTKGPFKKLRAFFSSAYAVDNLKARVKSVLSLGKLKVITAENSKEATDKIIDKLGSKGFVSNLTIDYHAGTFGNESLSSSTKELSRLANGYAGEESTCYLGQCRAGGNATIGQADYTTMISRALNGATTYGNQAAASSISFALFSHFKGRVPESYAKSIGNTSAIGLHIVSGRSPTTGQVGILRVTNRIVRIENSGEIVEDGNR